jgi:hypothetical protein
MDAQEDYVYLLELDKMFGLPAHPLLVHAAVVLVPVAALGWIAIGWKEAWRRIYYLPLALMAIAGSAAAFLAKESGEPLSESIRRAGERVGEHPEQGDTAFVLSIVFAATCLALYLWQSFGEWVRERAGWQQRLRLPVDENVALWVVSLPVAALAIWAMIVAGHSGATLVWKTNQR